MSKKKRNHNSTTNSVLQIAELLGIIFKSSIYLYCNYFFFIFFNYVIFIGVLISLTKTRRRSKTKKINFINKLLKSFNENEEPPRRRGIRRRRRRIQRLEEGTFEKYIY